MEQVALSGGQSGSECVEYSDTENELIYANLDGEVKGFKNPTIEIVEKAIRLALPRIS